MEKVTVIGAGLAGSEAAYQLAKRGIKVTLIEMRPSKTTPAHKTAGFAELVCSNSLRSDRVENAVGLLKEELRIMGSLIMEAAEATKVPAGGALAVDRDRFSAYITEKIRNNENIEVIEEEVTKIPDGNLIIASGPLTSDALSDAIADYFGMERLHFFDAVAPIVSAESINMDRVFQASRYGHGDSDDYLNCPMSEDEYFAFVEALTSAERAPVHGFETINVFEGCMPVESMADRGVLTLAHGPLKPMGLVDPRTGRRPYAVVQLRMETENASCYNLVGFQTRLKWGEQKRVFSMIPGLENAEFLRYGVMHRNTFVSSPGLLNPDFSLRQNERMFIAGQLSGVEGYIESTSSGMLAALSMASKLEGGSGITMPDTTAIGALGQYVSRGNGMSFQPMNVNFGIMAPLNERIRDKKKRAEAMAQRALDEVRSRF